MLQTKKIIHIFVTVALILFFSGLFFLTFMHIYSDVAFAQGSNASDERAYTNETPAGGAESSGVNGSGGSGTNGSGGNGINGSGGSKIINPLAGKADDIPTFLLMIINILLVFATPFIVLFIMYAGYLFVTAAGNPSEIESARSALLWAVVGGVIILAAKIILGVIQGTVAGLT